MAVNRSEIRTYLKEWSNTVSKPRFAVLIDGEWGCGKTHFILKLLKDESFTSKKKIYLSLFGVPDIQSLETDLFYASVSKFVKNLHKGVGFGASVMSGTLTYSSGGLFGGKANLNSVVEAATLKLEQSTNNMDSALLVLDDLERCKIPKAELLGLVNRFVEHGDTRVILIANTRDLKDEDFVSFREKVIGHSFQLDSEPDHALSAFVDEVKETVVRDVIAQNLQRIRALYVASGYHNLRALRQFVWQLAAVIDRMENQHRENLELVENLIVQFFVFFIEFKLDLSNETKSLEPKDLLQRSYGPVDSIRLVHQDQLKTVKESNTKLSITNSYEQPLLGIRTVVSVRQWVSILESGVVDAQWFNQELALADEVVGVDLWPSWKRLWYFQDLELSDETEEQIWKDVADIRSKLNNGQYLEIGEFLHAVGITLMLDKIGLTDRKEEELVQELKAYIDDHLIPQMNYEVYLRTPEEFGGFASYDGHAFMMFEENGFQAVHKHLNAALEKWRTSWLSDGAGKELVAFLSEGTGRFLGNLTVTHEPGEQRYLDVPVLATIDASEFVEAWLNVPRKQAIRLLTVLKSRYKTNSELAGAELNWWRLVKKELFRRLRNSKKKTTMAQLQLLVVQAEAMVSEVRTTSKINK